MSNQRPSAAILEDILKELARAKKKHPRWPDHVCGQAGVVVEEAGELMRAAINYKYEGKKAGKGKAAMIEDLRMEAIHTCASAIRFLENLK